MATHKITTFPDPVLDLQIRKLVDAIKDLQEQIDALEARVTALEP